MKRKSKEEPLSEINITPLTDVILVLLIIFMISSPVLLARGMEVHLPQVEHPQMLEPEDHTLYILANGTIQLDGEALTEGNLPEAFAGLVAEADSRGETVNLFIHADESVTYGQVTRVMDAATRAGIEKISLVQEVLGGEEIPSSNALPPEDAYEVSSGN